MFNETVRRKNADIWPLMQHGYRTLIAAEAVGDFEAALHAVHLRDLEARHADVIPVDELLAYFRSTHFRITHG